MLNSPPDFLGAIFAKMLSAHLSSENAASKMRQWAMRVVLRTDYYPLSLLFRDGLIISKGEIESPTLVVTTTFHYLLRVLAGEISLLRAFITGKIKLQGFFRHPVSSLRFYRLINALLKG